MSVIISEDILHSTHLSESELKQEIAVMLFEKDKLTMGQAARFAEMSQWRFQHLLASRAIPVHYDVKEFEQDLASLRQSGRI